MMVEVFTTNVLDVIQAESILQLLENRFPELKINFDLDDSASHATCRYSILRIEGVVINVENIMSTLNNMGFMCDVLEDKICK